MKSIIKNLTIKQKNIIAGTIAIWGIILIGSGTVMTLSVKPTTTTKQVKLKVVQKRIAEIKSNEIKLKDIELEINQPLSVNVKDYLQNPNDIEEKIIKSVQILAFYNRRLGEILLNIIPSLSDMADFTAHEMEEQIAKIKKSQY